MPDARPILICFDRSAGARHAIDVAASLLRGHRALVMTVWSAPVGMAVHGMAVEEREYEKEQQRRAVESAAEGCGLARDAGLDAEALTACGIPDEGTAHAILDAADAQDASLIVLGARGLSGLRSLILGSVSHGVVHHARRPVLVVPDAVRPVDAANAS
jgi:nucleotide-binding universal stress UspA family protein